MNIKEYLNQAFYLDRLIKANKVELERLRELVMSIGSLDLSRERVQENTYTDKTGERVARIVDLEREIQSETDRYVEVKADIRRLIMSVEDNRLKLILQERFLNFKKFEDIANEMVIEISWLFRLFKGALREAEKKSGENKISNKKPL